MNFASGQTSPNLASGDSPHKIKRWLTYAVWVVLLLIVVTEVAGRALGLQHPVLFERTSYGYRIAPNQDIHRLGHRVFFNALGLRSEPTTALPADGVVRILCLGDSVTYGGASIDQTETWPNRLQERLSGLPERVEALNASAPGWAIDNEFGWLREHGTLGSRYVVLTISTHDLFQPLAPSAVVDGHVAFPSRPPLLALHDLAIRYVLPRVAPWLTFDDPGVGGDEPWTEQLAQANRDTMLSLDQQARAGGSTLVVLFSAEDVDPKVALLAKVARQRMFDLLARKNISVLTMDEVTRQRGHSVLYRDRVHPNAVGNQVMASVVADFLRPRIVSAAPNRG